MTRFARRAVSIALAGLAVPLLAAAAWAGEPVDPAGTLFAGKERQKGLGKTPVTLHLAPDGTAAGGFVDPQALAAAWTGTWSAAEGTLTVDLAPILGVGDPIACDLRLTPKGAVGTVTRMSATPVVTRTKLVAVHPARKPKGWSAVVPLVRSTGGTAAGDIRGTLLVRRVGPPSRKPLPIEIRPLGDDGLPGLSQSFLLGDGAVLRFEGPLLPALPQGVDRDAFQFVVTGKKGFGPGVVEVIAYEEVLRGPAEPATSGTPLPVHWVRALSKKERAAREIAPLAAPWFLDDDGAGALPRETRLRVRDLSPFTGDAPAGSVRVSVRTLAGVEVASSTVALPRGALVDLRPFDLLSSPGDLPGGEGQVRITRTDGVSLPRGSVAALLSGTVRQASTAVASIAHPLSSPESTGRSARIAFPFVRAPDDGSASGRARVLSLAPDQRVIPVAVAALDGTVLMSANLFLDAGATTRLDPESLGMDLSTIPGGECQVTVGDPSGLPTDMFLAQGENRETGTPDTFFAAPAGWESAHAAAAPVRIDLLDARETLGSDPGDRDAWIVIRNGGTADAVLALSAFDDAGLGLQGGATTPFTVAPGESLRISVEQALVALGVPPDPGLDYRGCLTLEGTAGGPLSAIAIQLKRSANAIGGYALPVSVR